MEAPVAARDVVNSCLVSVEDVMLALGRATSDVEWAHSKSILLLPL